MLEPVRFDPAPPRCLFVVLADPPAERELEFHRWYDTVHGPDAFAGGSFTALHRFRAAGGGRHDARFLALWEGRFGSEAEASVSMRAGGAALRESGRISDVVSVRFAIMLFPALPMAGAPCDDVHALTTVQNDWRHAATAPPVSSWWDATGLDAAPATTRWLATSDPGGRGPGFHLALFAASGSVDEVVASWRDIGTPGSSPLPPYQTMFGELRGPDPSAPEPEPSPAWVTHWEPVISLRS